MESVLSFLTSWQFVLFFYIGIILLIYRYKEKFEFQAKFIALRRTKIGLKSMAWLATKFKKPIIVLGYIGIVVGYLGMLVIIFFIFQGMWNLLFRPEAPATLAPVIPGVKIPGSPIFVPFWYGMLSLFIVIVIHEFSHGVVSKAHGIPVKSSGFVLFGPIPGAFVEPDEKILMKKKPAIQNAVFAAGPFSNVITALIIVGIFGLILAPAMSNLETTGVSFKSLQPGFPAEAAGVIPGETYYIVDGEEIKDVSGLMTALEDLKPEDTITLESEQSAHIITATNHPNDAEKGYLGVLQPYTRFANDDSLNFKLTLVLIEFLNWLFLLSLGLGLANLLPLGPVDGGRMYQLACRKFFGEKKGDIVWAKTAIVFLGLIVVLVFVPILKAVLM